MIHYLITKFMVNVIISLCLLLLSIDLGLLKCIEHVWRDTIVYLDDDNPITIGRAYGRVSRHLLHEELLRR